MLQIQSSEKEGVQNQEGIPKEWHFWLGNDFKVPHLSKMVIEAPLHT
jgi:hypothetical protein